MPAFVKHRCRTKGTWDAGGRDLKCQAFPPRTDPIDARIGANTYAILWVLARVAWGHEHFLRIRYKYVAPVHSANPGANTYAGLCVLARVAHEDRSAQAAQAEIAWHSAADVLKSLGPPEKPQWNQWDKKPFEINHLGYASLYLKTLVKSTTYNSLISLGFFLIDFSR